MPTMEHLPEDFTMHERELTFTFKEKMAFGTIEVDSSNCNSIDQ